MAKQSGTTRRTTFRDKAQVDEYAVWRAAEGSEKYEYDPDKVRFVMRKPFIEDTGEAYDGITKEDLRYKSDFIFRSVQRNLSDGKFSMGSGDYWFDERMTYNQAINRAIKEIKDGYKHNEKVRDHVMKIESDDDNAPTAWVWAELVSRNKVRISITRFRP